MNWKRTLAYLTGRVDDELLKRNEYLAAENRILKTQIKGRLRLTDGDRRSLAELAHRLGRRALLEITTVVTPDTLLRWYRRLVAKKFDGSRFRSRPGRPKICRETEGLIVRLARENRSWGYDRIAGALANLGIRVSDQTVGNVLERRGLEPAPERRTKTTWKEFIHTHMATLAATDFFSVEVLRPFGLVTYYVLFFIHLASRRVWIAGITEHPDEAWMKQMARNATMAGVGFLMSGVRYLIHDRDAKYAESFRAILKSAGVEPIALPPMSPNLNAYAERFVRSVKGECLDRMIFVSEPMLEHALRQFETHYNGERPHQGVGNRLLDPPPDDRPGAAQGRILTRSRLGGLLRHYFRRAA